MAALLIRGEEVEPIVLVARRGSLHRRESIVNVVLVHKCAVVNIHICLICARRLLDDVDGLMIDFRDIPLARRRCRLYLDGLSKVIGAPNCCCIIYLSYSPSYNSRLSGYYTFWIRIIRFSIRSRGLHCHLSFHLLGTAP